jgi:nucleoside-diphosphate-sugar epimerase
MESYVVTGCAGFIGSHLSEALVRDGHEVIGIDNFSDVYVRARKEANLRGLRTEEHFHLVEADLVELNLDRQLESVSGVFHLAARPGVRASWGPSFKDYVRENVMASQRLFESAANAGVRVLLASSSSVYGDAETYPTREGVRPRPLSPYGVSKLCCEELGYAYTRSFALDLVTLRFFSVYGPRQRPDMAFTAVLTCILRREPFRLFGSGLQSRDFTYVSDVVNACLLAMGNAAARATFNVGGGSETTLLDAIALCERLSGRPLELQRTNPAAGDVQRTAADTGLIRKELGWAPRTSLEEGLDAQLRWLRNEVG